MNLRNFRQLFVLVFTLILVIFGINLGLLLPKFSAYENGLGAAQLTANDPSFPLKVTIGLALVGLLLGISLGPRIGDLIVAAGWSLERMSASDKIAVLLGTALGIVVTLLFSQLLSRTQIPLAFQVGIFILLAVIFIYLGIVAMMSMKVELVGMLARGAPAGAASETPEATTTANCKILDTNVIIDGRIADVCRTGFIEGTLYVPGFVLEELQHIADSGDNLKRARGRRGLDILNNMQKELPLVVRSWDKMLDKSAAND
ncbi:MAG TPA: hypothetical protein VKT32_07840, partial [Chthonomonadaceae bacterium]|nr:hypothetical protein [Chthonomonadaceae bacterium]